MHPSNNAKHFKSVTVQFFSACLSVLPPNAIGRIIPFESFCCNMYDMAVVDASVLWIFWLAVAMTATV